jgi:predicted DNA-binding transcriptional regulator
MAEKDDFDAWVDGLEEIEHQIILIRALNALGWSYEITATYVDFNGEDEDSVLQEALHEQYVLRFTKELVAALIQNGSVAPTEVYENGHIGYVLAQGTNGETAPMESRDES